MLKATVVEAGCDYITASCMSRNKARRFRTLAQDVITAQERGGDEPFTWSGHGYEGIGCGSAQFGRRPDGLLIRFSSAVAHAHWREVYDLASNVSRFDVQATYRLDTDVEAFIARNAQRATAFRNSRKRGSEVEYRRRTDQSSTLYIGQRVSDRFLRMYNKWGESKDDYYRGCVRYEAEFKNDLALRAAEELREAERESDAALARISHEFTRKHCRQLSPAADCSISSPRKRSKEDRTLLWLTASCRSPVARLIERGRLEDVLKALGLTDHVKPVRSPRR